jgi:hypothetical protein
MSDVPDLPLLRLIFWVINTPGLGGIYLGAIEIICVGGFLAALRWIARGRQADEKNAYAYPTSTLLDHE